MRDYIDDYLSYVKFEKKLSENTYESYKLDLISFNNYLSEDVSRQFKDLNENDIINYLKHLKEVKRLNSRSIERHLTTLRNFYKYLYKVKIVSKNIMVNIDNMKVMKKLPNTLNIEEIDNLFDIKLDNPFDYRTKAMLELMYGSGLRVSELVNLTLYSIDLYNNTIIIEGKGNKERIVPLGEVSKKYLELYLEKRSELIKRKNGVPDKLFLNNHGLPITRNGFNYLINNILREKKIDKKVTPHTLRHSFATHMLNNGANLRTIQELLGHTDIVTTRIYTHVSNEKIHENYDKYTIRSDEFWNLKEYFWLS